MLILCTLIYISPRYGQRGYLQPCKRWSNVCLCSAFSESPEFLEVVTFVMIIRNRQRISIVHVQCSWSPPVFFSCEARFLFVDLLKLIAPTGCEREFVCVRCGDDDITVQLEIIFFTSFGSTELKLF